MMEMISFRLVCQARLSSECLGDEMAERELWGDLLSWVQLMKF